MSLLVYWHVGFAVPFARQRHGWNFDSIVESQLSFSDFLLLNIQVLLSLATLVFLLVIWFHRCHIIMLWTMDLMGMEEGTRTARLVFFSGLLWLLLCISLVRICLCIAACCVQDADACIQFIWVETELFYVLLLCTRKEPGRLIRVMLVCGIMLYYLFWTKSMKANFDSRSWSFHEFKGYIMLALSWTLLIFCGQWSLHSATY